MTGDDQSSILLIIAVAVVNLKGVYLTPPEGNIFSMHYAQCQAVILSCPCRISQLQQLA